MIPKSPAIDSLLIRKKRVTGEYRPPADKSITHRAVFFSALSTEASRIKNPLFSGDCGSTFSAFQNLGLKIKAPERMEKEWVIPKGVRNAATGLRQLNKSSRRLNCGNSGTTMRLLSGLLSGQKFSSTLIGDDSLSRRPMKRVIAPLRKMGAVIEAKNDNFAPIVIKPSLSGLKGCRFENSVASAQVKSSIMLAGLHAQGRTEIIEPERSRDHTERMLEDMGARIRFKKTGSPLEQNKISIEGGAELSGLDITVPGDFSSAAFFVAAALIVPGSDLTIIDVNLNPTRTGLLGVLKRMGADIGVENLRTVNNEPLGNLRVRYSELNGTQVGAEEIPLLIDEIPILSVIATQAKGVTEISGAEELRVKESDRLAAVASELNKMGANVEEKKDGLIIAGPVPLEGAIVQSYHDHRMAMSLAVAGLVVVKSANVIKNFDCVLISFPRFWEHFTKFCLK